MVFVRLKGEHRLMKAWALILLLPLLMAFPLRASQVIVRPHGHVYSVKSSGGDFSTIQACANVAGPGDVCEVYSGTYSETVTVARPGSPTLPIVFRVRGGETVLVTAFVLTNRAHITIDGFEITNASSHGILAQNGAHHAIIQNNYIHSSGGGCIRFGLGTSDDVIIRHNRLANCGGNGITFNSGTTTSPGDRLLIEDNEISSLTEFDAMYLGGNHVVIRNNYIHDIGTVLGAHIDGIQHSGQEFSYVLIEGNTTRTCTDTGGNCHAFITRNVTAPAVETIIYRYNYAQDLAGPLYILLGDTGDDIRHAMVYNNTSGGDTLRTDTGQGVSMTSATNSVAKNNIVYQRVDTPYNAPWIGASTYGGNLAFTSGYAGGWGSPYSTESTYAALHSQDPLFANYPNDATLQSGSPARNAGVALTAVAAADTGSGTSLIVDDAHYFQDGWSGVNADWLRVGASTAIRVVSINYDANAITLASSIARNDGDPVYLYRDSSYRVRISTASPDVGARPYP